MKIPFINNYFKIEKPKQQTKEKANEIPEVKTSSAKSKLKTSALAAFFLLPTLGTVNAKPPESILSNKTELQLPNDEKEKYIKKGERSVYVIQKGDTPEKIAKKFNISTRRLLFENGMTKKSKIYPDKKLIIPESYTVKNIKTLYDAAKASGFSKKFLEELADFETVRKTIYTDRNNNKTIGIGHFIKKEELKLYQGKKLSPAQIYTIFTQDLINIDLDLKTVINQKQYEKLPFAVKESVMDLAFNKGTGAIADNKKLLDALNRGDLANAIANINQDYSIVKNAKGENVKKPASGLSKRRLYDMANASRIFKKGMPAQIFKSAKEVYARGLKYLEAEKNRGEIPASAYKNVVREYKDLAYKWYGGKLGEKAANAQTKPASAQKTIAPRAKTAASSVSKTPATVSVANSSTPIYVKGKKTKWTVGSLYADWQKTAERQKRYVKRPMPEVDKNGSIKASVKTLDPSGKGVLSGKTILINPGHGGCMNNIDNKGKINVNFDPGTSNAVMSKANPNVETNVFIANGGKALEEWVVNQRIADELVKKIRKAGAKVIYVQGSVYSASKAIVNIQKKQKINMIVSLHSNSDGGKRGIYVIANSRGNDQKDKALAKLITNKMNEHSWFRGITKQTAQPLAVLSIGRHTSPVPGVLIETGNLKNEKDIANLNSSKFKAEMVESIFESIKDYLK